MIRYIAPGGTFMTQGTLGSANYLIFEAGTPTVPAGDVLHATGHAENLGRIALYGASTASATGATLLAEGVLTNAGVVIVDGAAKYAGAALLAIENTVTNTGTITVQYGIYGTGGQMLISAGATLTSSADSHAVLTLGARAFEGTGSATLTDIGVLINAAGNTVNVDAATATRPSAADGAQLLVTGTLQNGGTLNVVGAGSNGSSFTPENDGTISVSGLLQNTGLVQVGVSGGGVLLDSGTLTNTGSIVLAGFGYSDHAGSCGTLDVTGVLDNSGYILLDPASSAFDAGVMTNSGSLVLGGGLFNYTPQGSTASITGALTNTNAVIVEQDSSLTVAGPGSLINEAIVNVDGGAETLDDGNTYVDTPGSLNVLGTLANSGTLTVGGGLSGFDKPSYAYGGLGSQLSVAGVLTNTGTVSVDGGGGGYRYFGREARYGTGATLTLSGVMNNAGLIEVHDGAQSYAGLYGTGATLIDSGTLTNTGTIVIAGGPAAALLTVTAAGTLANSGTIEGTGSFDNAGLLTTSGGTIATTTLLNTGTIALAADTVLTIDSAIAATPSGVVEIAAHASLSLAGSVATGQHIAFAGADATLVLANPASFAGALTGFAPGDSIDFATFSLTAAATSANAIDLTLANGATFDLRLDAPLAPGSTLQLSSDHHGGTDLTLHQSAYALGAVRLSYGLTSHDASTPQAALGSILTVHQSP